MGQVHGWTLGVAVSSVAMSHTGAAGSCAARALTLPEGAIRIGTPQQIITTSDTTADSGEFGMNPGRISDVSRASGINS
jgi:hypothetical protein